MSFRRIPFQFSSTDPGERQAELEKRFGLHSARNNMHVNPSNPIIEASANKVGDISSSPRLQHRVPIFMEGSNQPIKKVSVDSNFDNSRKPNVRVIPIELEGTDCQEFSRHRTFSGPERLVKGKEYSVPIKEDSSSLKRSVQDISQPTNMTVQSRPKVYNVPIQFEGRNNSKSPKLEKVGKQSTLTKNHPQVNGCASSKLSSKCKPHEKETEQNVEPELPKIESSINDSLKKIESILEDLKSYESSVKEFTGTVKDKKYRYLDEMLTRCMLRLDDIDTMGNEHVRATRKSAIKAVQASIDLLETKVNTDIATVNVTEVNSGMQDSNELKDHIPDIEDQCESTDLKQVNELEIAENRSFKNDSTIAEVEAVDILQNEMNNSETDNEVPEVDMAENDATIAEVEVVDIPRNEINNSATSNEVPEVEMVENDATIAAVTEVEAVDIPRNEINNSVTSNEVPEVEMAENDAIIAEGEVVDIPRNEINNSATSNEVPEVEMAESKTYESEDLIDRSVNNMSETEISDNNMPSSKLPQDKNEDVEMRDIKNSPNDKDNPVDRKISKSDGCSKLDDSEDNIKSEDHIGDFTNCASENSTVTVDASEIPIENKNLEKICSKNHTSTGL